MKQRLCGKIIKHKDRYSDEQILQAYERSVRSLRKFYMKCYKNDEGIANYYAHKAAQSFYIMCDEIDEIWCVGD